MSLEPLGCQREAFHLPADVHYLNCAYLSPHPRSVEEAGIRAIRRGRAPTDFPPESFFEDSDRLRRRFARLIGAPAERIAILPAVSYGVAIAARNLDVEPGQNLVVAEDQFPSNVYAWRALAADAGLELRVVPRPSGARDPGGRWSARVQEAVDSATAAVALPHVHWTDGTAFDLVSIGTRAREAGAALVLDGSQSVGAFPIDVAALRPDALICTGYKWLLGPYSLALGYFGSRYDDARPLEETWIGRRGSRDFQGLVRYRDEYQPGAERLDVGERSNFILTPMLIAALDLLLAWRPERVQEYCRRLLSPMAGRLRERGVDVRVEGRRAWHILGFPLPPGAEGGALERGLSERGVYASLRGSSLRVSPNAYNDESDVVALEEALVAVL